LTAVAPSASLLCVVWCPPASAAAGACEHTPEALAPAVTSQHDCRGGDALDSRTMPGGIWRLPAGSAATLDAAGGLMLQPGSVAMRLAHRGLRPPPPSKRPLTTPLRV
jgi:hypothetical protein